MEEKIANHACMNERIFSGISYGEQPHRDAAQRNRDVALNSYKFLKADAVKSEL